MGISINGQTDIISATDGTLGIGGTVAVDITGDVTGNVTGDLYTVGSGTTIFSPATNVLTLGTNNGERLRINSDGVVTIPGHPIMEVYTVTVASRTVSGNSNTTLIPFNAANAYDPGGDLNNTTGVYTAPATGRYLIHYGSDGKTAANAYAGSIYYALNGTENFGQCLFYGDAYSGNHRELVISLTANDTVHFHLRGNNNQSYTVNNAYYGIRLIG